MLAAVAISLLWFTSLSSTSTKVALSFLGGIAAVSAWFPLNLRLSETALKPFVYLSSISYGVYAIHFPILLAWNEFAFARHWSVKVLGAVLTTAVVAHLLERTLQPRLKVLALSRRRSLEAAGAE